MAALALPPGPPPALAASDILTWGTSLVTKVENLLPIIAILLVGIAVLRVYYRSQGSLVPTLTTLLIGGAVVWGVMNVTWFRDSVGGLFNAPAPHTVVSVVQPPPPGSLL